MFERFTESAREAVVFAQQDAVALRHNFIGTEHLLLGVLKQESIAARALRNLDVTYDDARREVSNIVGSGEEVGAGQMRFTPRAKKVFELALREALVLGHDYIGTEHILLGLVRDDDGIAVGILRSHGAEPERVRAAVMGELGIELPEGYEQKLKAAERKQRLTRYVPLIFGTRRPLVLCYHAVSPTWEHRLCIQPDLLLRQVRALSRFWKVHVTFDDAFRSAATVFPELQRLGVPIEIFVCTKYALVGAPLAIPELAGDDPGEVATMSWDELRDHAARGIAIGSHAVSHPHLTTLSDENLRRELTESKREIQDRLGRQCEDLAYPYGEHDARVRAAARTAGYGRAYALRGTSSDAYAAPRLDLYRRHTVPRTLLRALTRSPDRP